MVLYDCGLFCTYRSPSRRTEVCDGVQQEGGEEFCGLLRAFIYLFIWRLFTCCVYRTVGLFTTFRTIVLPSSAGLSAPIILPEVFLCILSMKKTERSAETFRTTRPHSVQSHSPYPSLPLPSLPSSVQSSKG